MNFRSQWLSTMVLSVSMGCGSGVVVTPDVPGDGRAPVLCNLPREVERIMSEQVGVVDCGVSRPGSTLGQVEEFVGCVRDAVLRRQPVRAEVWFQGQHGLIVHDYLGRFVDGQSNCIHLYADGVEPTHLWIDLTLNRGPVTAELVTPVPDTPSALLGCSGGSIGSVADPYDPPRVIPSSGRICVAR